MEEKILVTVNKIEDFIGLDYRYAIEYTCRKCGRLVRYKKFYKDRIPYYSKFLCINCLRKTPEYQEMYKRRWDNLDQAKKDEITARLRENNKIVVDNWNKKSDEEKQEIINKRNETRHNKPIEEIEATNKRLAEQLKKAWENMTEEQKQAAIAKMRNTKMNKSPEEKANIAKAISDVQRRIAANRTPEEKKILSEIHKRAWINKPNEEVEAMKEKCSKASTYIWNYLLTFEEKRAIHNKAVSTLIKTTGCPHPIIGKINYYGIRFDSSWELAIWIYCIDHGISIVRTPTVFHFEDMNGKICDYIPDFMIDGNLVEIKGDQFFKSDGTMHYPYTKLHRKSHPLTSEEKAYYDDLYERKHQCMLANNVDIWMEKECEHYLIYCDEKYPGWKKRFRKDNPLNPSYWCFNFVNLGYFQPMYFVPIIQPPASPFDKPDDDGFVVKGRGISPYDIPQQ